MQQYVMNAEPKLIQEVDEIVKTERLYSSRNEFVRDAVRSKVLEYRKLKISRLLKDAGQKALERGWNSEIPSKEERGRIAKEFLEKKGLSMD